MPRKSKIRCIQLSRLTFCFVRVLCFLCGIIFFSVSLYAQQTNGKRTVEQLIVALDSENQFVRQQALIELETHGTEAATATTKLCSFLESDNFAFRSFASNALVAIGSSSVESVRSYLSSDSSSARAAALQTLGRLNSISVQDIAQTTDDADPRVRSALAISLKGSNSITAITALQQLLADTETAVAIQAIISLNGKHDFSEKIVPDLCKALTRKELAADAAKSLGSFGTDASAAVPLLIKYRKSIDKYSMWQDLTETTLSHIGPPNPSGVAKLTDLLIQNDCDSTMLAARAIGLLGSDGKAAANSLEEAIDELIIRYERAKIEEQDPNWEDSYLRDNSAKYSYAAEQCAAAFWNVTGDAEKLIQLIKEIAAKSKEPVIFYDPPPWEIYYPQSPWETFRDKDIPLIERLLSSEDSHVVISGLHAVNKLGPRSIGLIDSILKVDERNFHETGLTRESFLSQLNPQISDNVDVDTQDKATEILQSNATARKKIEAISKLSAQSKTTIEFLIKCLSNPDAWTRHDAIVQLGLHASKSRTAKMVLLKLLENEQHEETRFQAEATLFLITGEKTRLEQLFATKMNLPRADKWHGADVMKTIASLGRKGTTFVHILAENEKWFARNNIEQFCPTLEKVGDATCQQILRRLIESNDWKTKTLARKALENIRSQKQKGERND